MTAKIKLNAASGGGSFSLQAPSSSSNARVMTLPDTADGTILTTTNPRSGNIIQVVQGNVVDNEHQFTTTSFAASDLSATNTPVFASSKILIHTTQVLDTGAAGRQLYLGIFRSIAGGTYTNISGGTQASNVGAYSSNARLIETAVIIKLDTPSYSVGQAITYKIYGKNSGSYETRVGGQQTEQLMVLQEVAA